MAHYLLRLPDETFEIVNSDSARQAIDNYSKAHKLEGTFRLWTLRGSEARIFEVATETVRTIKQT